MAIGNAPFWKTQSSGHTVYNGTGADLAPNLVLVADSGSDLGAKLPATAQVVQAIKGVSQATVKNGTLGTAHARPGETVVVKASGAIAKGDAVYLDCSAGKEGMGKKYTNFATNGSQFILGTAETGCADGELFSLQLGGLYRNGAA